MAGALFLALASLLSCSEGAPAQADNGRGAGKRPQPKPAPIAVAQIEIGEAVSLYKTTATLEAEYHAQILSRTTGVVRQLFHEEGDFVEMNQALLQLEDDDQKLQVKQAQIKVNQLKEEYQRNVRMRDAGVLSSQEFEQIDNQVEQAEAELEAARLNLSYTTVRAPFSGRVVRRLVDLGAHVQGGAQLYEMMDVDPLLTRIHIPANRMGQVAAGQRVSLDLSGSGVSLTGVVRLISPIVDPDTGTVKVTAEIDEYPQGVRPGDFAEARVVTARREKAMLAPSVAVIEEQGKHIIFVTADGKAERRIVEVGFIESGMTEILSGVGPDELIVVKGQRDLRDGQRVEILEGAPGAKSEPAKAISEVG